MVSIALNDSVEPDQAEPAGSPVLGHTVQVALVIYLMPVIGLVCLIGGAAIMVDRVRRWISGSGRGWPRIPQAEPLPISRPMLARQKQRNRVGQ